MLPVEESRAGRNPDRKDRAAGRQDPKTKQRERAAHEKLQTPSEVEDQKIQGEPGEAQSNRRESLWKSSENRLRKMQLPDHLRRLLSKSSETKEANNNQNGSVSWGDVAGMNADAGVHPNRAQRARRDAGHGRWRAPRRCETLAADNTGDSLVLLPAGEKGTLLRLGGLEISPGPERPEFHRSGATADEGCTAVRFESIAR